MNAYYTRLAAECGTPPDNFAKRAHTEGRDLTKRNCSKHVHGHSPSCRTCCDVDRTNPLTAAEAAEVLPGCGQQQTTTTAAGSQPTATTTGTQPMLLKVAIVEPVTTKDGKTTPEKFILPTTEVAAVNQYTAVLLVTLQNNTKLVEAAKNSPPEAWQIMVGNVF